MGLVLACLIGYGFSDEELQAAFNETSSPCPALAPSFDAWG
jgi:hypothetical protein